MYLQIFFVLIIITGIVLAIVYRNKIKEFLTRRKVKNGVMSVQGIASWIPDKPLNAFGIHDVSVNQATPVMLTVYSAGNPVFSGKLDRAEQYNLNVKEYEILTTDILNKYRVNRSWDQNGFVLDFGTIVVDRVEMKVDPNAEIIFGF